jgi:RNA polymerase sigma-70 factor (ECF subfamily)
MMSGKHDPTPGDDNLATRASLLGRIKNWEDAKSWEEFTQTYSRLIRAVALKAGLTESEAKDVEQETLLCVAKTIHEFESNPERGTFKSWLLNLTRWRIADQFRRRSPAASGPAPASDATPTRTPTVERVPGPENLDVEWEVEWKKNLLETALARVGRKVKAKHLQIFDLYAMRHWPAGKVARELGVTRVQVYLVNHRLTKLMKREVEFLGRNLE